MYIETEKGYKTSPRDYMEHVLEKALIDVEAKAFEYTSHNVQVSLMLDKEEILFLLESLNHDKYKQF